MFLKYNSADFSSEKSTPVLFLAERYSLRGDVKSWVLLSIHISSEFAVVPADDAKKLVFTNSVF